MEFIKQNWLQLVVAVYLLGVTIYGHYRGVIRLLVGITSLVITILLVWAVIPHISKSVAQNPQIHGFIEKQIKEMVLQDVSAQEVLPGGEGLNQAPLQQTMINGLQLPDQMKESLWENNTETVYQSLGVDRFVDYLVDALIMMFLNVTGFILTYIIVYVIVRIVFKSLDLVAKLPVLSGLNHIAGALLGFVQGMLVLWIFLFVIAVFPETYGKLLLVGQIQRSLWLDFLYRNNVFTMLMMWTVRTVFKG
ncbi:MAG: CvpA family protein [Lachnospiraceae bacterium]|nr:CvpA family protein [Lachnospiraceae bacterium]